MKIYRFTIAFIVAFMLLLTGCGSDQVNGNGKKTTETRELTEFGQISISGAYDIEIQKGQTNTVEITTDSNIIPLIVTEVDDRNLSVHNKSNINFKLSELAHIKITAVDLDEITVSGANQLTVSDIAGVALKVQTNGSVTATLSGHLQDLVLKINGSGDVDASKLSVQNATVRLMGSGQVTVNASKKVDTKVTGTGTIQYMGNPEDVSQSIIGSGTIVRKK